MSKNKPRRERFFTQLAPRFRCKFCGAILKRDDVGLKCPTHNCQWEHGADEASEAKEKSDAD